MNTLVYITLKICDIFKADIIIDKKGCVEILVLARLVQKLRAVIFQLRDKFRRQDNSVP